MGIPTAALLSLVAFKHLVVYGGSTSWVFIMITLFSLPYLGVCMLTVYGGGVPALLISNAVVVPVCVALLVSWCRKERGLRCAVRCRCSRRRSMSALREPWRDWERSRDTSSVRLRHSLDASTPPNDSDHRYLMENNEPKYQAHRPSAPHPSYAPPRQLGPKEEAGPEEDVEANLNLFD